MHLGEPSVSTSKVVDGPIRGLMAIAQCAFYVVYVINPLRCPECGSPNHVFRALNEALLTISGDLAIETVLQRLVEVARRLIHASYGALGVADGGGGFRYFVTSGTSSFDTSSLDVKMFLSLLLEGVPYSTADLYADERFGGWPPGHPDLKSFLAVPIASGAEVVGSFYLGNENAWGFTVEHQALVKLLAPHAGLAIENARLYEHSRQLSVVQERNRLARELHDSVTQTLFSMKLAAESANVLIEDDALAARSQLLHLQELARQATAEMRALVFELRPPELETEGLVATLKKHIDALRRVHPIQIELNHRGERELQLEEEKEIFRIVQEALNNAIRHAQPSELVVELVMEEHKVHVSIADDGIGFDPVRPRKTRSLGLVSMNERAQSLGAELSISSTPGRGTVVTMELRS